MIPKILLPSTQSLIVAFSIFANFLVYSRVQCQKISKSLFLFSILILLKGLKLYILKIIMWVSMSWYQNFLGYTLHIISNIFIMLRCQMLAILKAVLVFIKVRESAFCPTSFPFFVEIFLGYAFCRGSLASNKRLR